MDGCKMADELLALIERDHALAPVLAEPSSYAGMFWAMLAHIQWQKDQLTTKDELIAALKIYSDVLETPDPDKKVHPPSPPATTAQPDKGSTPRSKGAASGPLKGK